MRILRKTSRLWAALLCAVLLCCAQSALAETFTGYAQGFHGQVSVTLTVENGRITKADVSGPNETPGIGSVPIEEAPEKIVAAQGADIDMVSGATETSKAIIEATKNAMKAAGLEVETCAHENYRESSTTTSLPAGENWKDNGDGTHSANGSTWTNCYCYDCGERFEKDHQTGLLTRKHSYSSYTGKCWDCGSACLHPKVTEYSDQYTLDDGENWKPDSNGKTHSAQGKAYDYQFCQTCGKSWEANVVYGPVTQKHDFWDGECHDCGYECPHENITEQYFNSWQLKDGERWVDDKNGMTHTGKCEVYDYFFCSDCRNGYQINIRDEVVTQYHSGTNKCYDCGTYNIIDRNYHWWIDEQPKNVIVSVGETVKTSVQVWKSDKAPSVKYAWYFKDPGSDTYKKSTVTGRTYSTTMTKAMNGRQVYCVVTDAYGAMERSEVAFIMLPEFRITTQPKSATASAGESVTFTVKATGSGLKYQWYYRDAGAEEWEKSTVTKSSYTTTMKKERDGREIYCEVKDGSGEILKTRIVTMKLPALQITKQPKNASAYEDEKAKISVEATGDGLTYTWYYKDQGKDDFTKSTTTTATYSLTMNAARDGRQVYCVVSDAYGKSVQTNTVTLDTRFKATITSQPKSAMVSAGEKAKFTVAATGDGLTYQWQYKKSGSSTWTNASSTSTAYSFTMKESYDGRQIRCKVKDEYGNTATTNAVNLKLPVAKITTQPKSATVSVGEKAEFTVAATGDGLTYQWQYKKSGSSTWTNASSTSTAYSFTMKESYDGRQIRCKVKDAYGNTATTNAVNLKLPVAKITSQPKSKSVAVGDKATFTIKATGDGLTYQWYYKKAGSSTWSKSSTGTSATYSFTMKESYDGRSIRCKVKDAYGNTVTSSSAKLTLE